MPAGAAYGNKADREAGRPGGNMSQSGKGSQGGSSSSSGGSLAGVRNQTTGGFEVGGKTADPISASAARGSAYQSRLGDYSNVKNTTGEDIGNFIAGMLGFNEQQPGYTGKDVLNNPSKRTTWGYDPAGMIAGLAGSALGVPGLGLIANQISKYSGRPLEIGMGEDVFGGSEGAITGNGTGKGSRSGKSSQSMGSSGAGKNTDIPIPNPASVQIAQNAPAKKTPAKPGSTPVTAVTPTSEIDKIIAQIMGTKFVPPARYNLGIGTAPGQKQAA